jgi:hypothetical protein
MRVPFSVVFFNDMLSVNMLNVIVLSGIALSGIAPLNGFEKNICHNAFE